MDSISLTTSVGLRGRGLGVSANASLQSPIAAALNASFSSTLTGGSKITTGMKPIDQSLAASGTVTWDTRNFTSFMNETAQSCSKIRFFMIHHLTTSTSSGLVVGNAASNAWTPFSMAATNTFTLKAGDAIVLVSANTTGMVSDATHKNILLTNSDGSNAALYRIMFFADA